MSAKKWRESTMREAVTFAYSRTVDEDPVVELCLDDQQGSAVEVFTDGTAIACRSDYCAYASDSWPEPPEWFIYD